VSPFFLIPFVAGVFSLLLALVSTLRAKRSPAPWLFCAGMTALGLDSVFTGLSLRAVQQGDVIAWLTPAFIVKAFVPAPWLAFSVIYSRNNYREFFTRWKAPVAFFVVLPIVLTSAVVSWSDVPTAADDLWWLQSGTAATALNVAFLIALVLILMNLEQTFRAAVGTMRWRIKFVVVALAVIFGARLYVRSQAILFSAPDITLWNIESGALLVGCLLLSVAYVRTRWAESDVYPSLAVMRSSLTVVIVGGYLFVVGILAQLVRRFGGAEIFQFQAIVVLVGVAGLAVVLFSDRRRQKIHTFVLRHFSKAQHDSVRIWSQFSQRLTSVTDPAGLCSASARLVSESFDALSVVIWLLDEESGRLKIGASTKGQAAKTPDGNQSDIEWAAVANGLGSHRQPFDLEAVNEPWADELRQHNSSAFSNGGNRLAVPLCAGEQTVGMIVLSDRVGGAIYTIEELELLKCIGDQVTSVLLNVRLGGEVARARELEAFRTMSAFFVHDLKNTAASLNLMLKNLPVHFDDPEFRADALRGIANTARRIDEMIARLSALRQRPESLRAAADLNQLVSEALDRVEGMPNVQLTRELLPLPPIVADREQIQSVVTNLVLNARDALSAAGAIQVRTETRGDRVVLSVTDNGCGMSPAFVSESLFRPFQSTKKKGLGIGLFQTRAIVNAHGGRMHVESEVGKGTTFVVSLPAVQVNE
jgi:putative PEP-CTERM system histidine kinase